MCSGTSPIWTNVARKRCPDFIRTRRKVHLVHCHVGDPEVAMVINGESVGHVEQELAPSVVRLASGIKTQDCGNRNGTSSNFPIAIVT